MSVDKVLITGIKTFGYHGVFEDEKKNGQTFIIDLEYSYDTNKATQTDDLIHAIDYGSVAIRTKAIVETGSFNLIEKLADHLAETLLKEFTFNSIKISIHKPNAPINLEFSDVVVVAERKK